MIRYSLKKEAFDLMPLNKSIRMLDIAKCIPGVDLKKLNKALGNMQQAQIITNVRTGHWKRTSEEYPYNVVRPKHKPVKEVEQPGPVISIITPPQPTTLKGAMDWVISAMANLEKVASDLNGKFDEHQDYDELLKENRKLKKIIKENLKL